MNTSLARSRLFLSYSHADVEYKQELLVHLQPLKDLVEIWHDQHLEPGVDWKIAIDEALAGADTIVLLVSPDFLASDYCINTELAKAFSRWSDKQTSVVPIIVRDCSWSDTAISRLQVLGAEKPIGSLDRRAQRDAEWKRVVQTIRALIQRPSQASVKRIAPHDTLFRQSDTNSGTSIGVLAERKIWRGLFEFFLLISGAIAGMIAAYHYAFASGIRYMDSHMPLSPNAIAAMYSRNESETIAVVAGIVGIVVTVSAAFSFAVRTLKNGHMRPSY